MRTLMTANKIRIDKIDELSVFHVVIKLNVMAIMEIFKRYIIYRLDDRDFLKTLRKFIQVTFYIEETLSLKT